MIYSAHSLPQTLRANAIFIALGVYTAVIGASWISFAASFN